MASDLLAMHRAFLAEIAAKREMLQSDLQELAAVEGYHRKIVEQLLAAVQANGESAEARSAELSDMRLLRATRFDACKIALAALGGQAKTQAVANWLQDRGYGTEFNDPRVFHNTCYTAMKRRSDMFEKVGAGRWKLLESHE